MQDARQESIYPILAGGFDRVSKKLLLEKLEAAGVSQEMLAFIDSYLQPRRSTVIVGGAKSREFKLEDTVFHRARTTVLECILRRRLQSSSAGISEQKVRR